MAPSPPTGSVAEPPTLEHLKLEVEGEIVTLQLDRPETLNAFDAGLISELAIAVEWCAAINDLGCLVITGVEKGFSAGGYLPTLQQGAADPSKLDSTVGYLAEQLNRTIRALHKMTCPVLAAVNGRAAGAGFSLALACDIRIASERAVFDFAYARVGATPDGGMTWFLPQIVGISRAIELLVQSPILRSQQVLELGLVSTVVPADDLGTQARALAKRLAKQPRHYVGAVKQLTRDGASTDLVTQLEIERTTLLASLSTVDARRRLSELEGGGWSR